MELMQIDDDFKLKQEKASEIVKNMFKMCSNDIFNALEQISYLSGNLFTEKESAELQKCATAKAKAVIKQIFKDKEEIYDRQFRDEVLSNLPWLLTPQFVWMKMTESNITL